METADFIFEPSGFAGDEAALSKIVASTKSGTVSIPSIESMFKDGWEQSLKFPQTQMPQLYLRSVLDFARATLSALVGECNESPTAPYKSLVDSGKVEEYNERVMVDGLYDRLLKLVGKRKWVELTEYAGPIKWGNVQIDLSPAEAIYKYVALPLIYGEWPSEEAWEKISFGRPKSSYSVPDALTGAMMLNQSSIKPDCIKRAQTYAFQQLSKSLTTDQVLVPSASTAGFTPPNVDLANSANLLVQSITEISSEDLYKGDTRRAKWLPWAFGAAVLGAGAFYVMRSKNE